MSVGVIIAAGIIYVKPEYWWCDPICTYLFSVIVMYTTIPLVKECIYVLMESTPHNIDVVKLENRIREVGGQEVEDVHDLHVWTLS